MTQQEDKKRPAALDLKPSRSLSSESSTSSLDSLKHPRTPRFVEATAVHSPIDGKSPFTDPKVADVGFGYIQNAPTQTTYLAPPMSPLKSALRSPTAPRRFADGPLSPTFREEQIVEKHEVLTDKEQARDVKVKGRVRLAKFALRFVNFGCSLIILAMISSTLAIFNSTRSLPTQSSMPAWAKGTSTWPQILVLSMACISLTACLIVFFAYCKGGHRRAEKVQTYYTMFAIGWFILSMILWAISAGIFQYKRNNSNNKDIWGWSCVDNKRSQVFSDKVDYALVCRLQNWALICMIIEIVVEVICIALYTFIFYRYYTKRRLRKTMDSRDKARSDMYLAQLRMQSAPNTPGFGPKSPALSNYAFSPRFAPANFASMNDIESQTLAKESPFTPGNRVVEPPSQFETSLKPALTSSPSVPFKLQAPPPKAPSATPKASNNGLSPITPTSPPFPTDVIYGSPAKARTPSPPPSLPTVAPVAADEPVYESVPIPGAYAEGYTHAR
ncbi:hypothetical protein CFO_g3581 [Ceratocystis platani]|uniref:Hyphal anastamosis-8 protein n=1 Tax=Ceratocystis fimbriata f. sp. platani TaxID=88771 RepID=A0A0F8BNH6_CERFI|nr:hypothetical protein CFO_g3581 [Ceratocystis platani]